MAENYESTIKRGRSRAILCLDDEEFGRAGGRPDHFAAGMLSAIGERLEARFGALRAAEIVAQFSDAVTMRVPPDRVRQIAKRPPSRII